MNNIRQSLFFILFRVENCVDGPSEEWIYGEARQHEENHISYEGVRLDTEQRQPAKVSPHLATDAFCPNHANIFPRMFLRTFRTRIVGRVS